MFTFIEIINPKTSSVTIDTIYWHPKIKMAKFNIILNNLVKKINQEQPKYFFKVVLILTGFIIMNTKQEMNFSIQLLSTLTYSISSNIVGIQVIPEPLLTIFSVGVKSPINNSWKVI